MAKIIIPDETDFGDGKEPIAGAMERFLNKEAEKEKSAQSAPKTQAGTQTSLDSWRISGVNYKGKLCDVDLAKTLLDNGNTKTQDEWGEYYKSAKQTGDFYTGDMHLYHAVFASLFNQKDKLESGEARAFIQKSMREKDLMTLTRIAYQPKGKDKIIHNYNTADQYEISEDIVGKDRAIIGGDSNTLTALLGDGDINKIKSIYNWINQTDTFIWRLNSKPKSINERVVRFLASSGRAGLGCSGNPSSRDSSLGVCLCAEGAQKIK